MLKNFNIWHYDLYRLSNKTEIFALDFDLALNDIVLIEWPAIIKDFLPSERIDIFFKEDTSIKIAVQSVKKVITTSVDKSKLDALFQKNLDETKEELKKINS